MTVSDLREFIRSAKARVHVPVTYADVWEFWLRYREMAPDVDFITVHMLPYWEDVPPRAEEAAAHVDNIRMQVAAAFPGKEILIGEAGWPSQGRMRDGSLASRRGLCPAPLMKFRRQRRSNPRLDRIDELAAAQTGIMFEGLVSASLVPKLGEQASPVVPRPARLDDHGAGRLFLEERDQFGPPQLALQLRFAGVISSVNLEDRFGDIQADHGEVHG